MSDVTATAFDSHRLARSTAGEAGREEGRGLGEKRPSGEGRTSTQRDVEHQLLRSEELRQVALWIRRV